MRVIYRFAGEFIPSARPDNPSKPVIAPGGAKPTGGAKVDAETGDVTTEGDKKVYQ